MKFKQFWRLLIISCLSLVMVACKPWADFTVNPSPVVAGVEATFDASSSMVISKDKQANYAWDFGDGSAAGTGKVVQHTFAAAGTYQVKLTVTDRKGQKGVVTRAVVVTPSTAATAAVSVQVQGSDGVPLANAKVDLGSLTAQTSDLGAATLANVATGADVVLNVTKTGYVTQSLRVTTVAGETARVFAILQPIKEMRSIPQAQVAQTIVAQSLGASVTLPANALVAPDNAVATGAIRMELTPWDITSSNLSAMLGNGVARRTDRSIVNLISAGMMTVDFYDAQNRHLQLAAGKTADIQMDLPYASINNQALSVGSSIPLWHFDAAQGLWVEEGVGSVVESTTSPVGLAVKATVSHFSTWNWDYVISGAVSTTVSCDDGAGQLVACNISLKATLPDGSSGYKWLSIGPAVTTVSNLPANATLYWNAQSGEERAEATSAANVNVVLVMKPPAIKNFVQCSLPDTTKVACSVLQMVSGNVQAVQIPAEGGWVRSYDTVAAGSTIAWSAQSGLILTAANQYFRYEGTASSGTTGAVNIVLSSATQVLEKTVQLKCAGMTTPTAEYPVSRVVTSCTFNMSLYVTNVGYTYLQTPLIPAGSYATFVLPPTANSINTFISASLQGGGIGWGEDSSYFQNLMSNQTIDVEVFEGIRPPTPF
jgi:PKD repeat protein